MSADYPRMYAILCGAASDAIDYIDRGALQNARVCLLTALETAEVIYLSEDYIAESERLNRDPEAAVPKEVTEQNLTFINNYFDQRNGR